MVRATYIPEDVDLVCRALLHSNKHYPNSAAAGQLGGSIVGFRGNPYQRGRGLGSFFTRLFRGLLPIAKSAAKAVGKEALRTGIGVAGDVLNNRQDLEGSLKTHGRAALGSLADQAKEYVDKQKGSGRRRRRKRAAKRCKPKQSGSGRKRSIKGGKKRRQRIVRDIFG